MPWLSFTTHVAAITGGVAAGAWGFRRSTDAVLRLVAGLVAILARDKQSRADRALEVLRAIQEVRAAPGHIPGTSQGDLPETDENR